MKDKAIKTRIAILCFLEFAVWGAYLTSMGNYLVNVGMGSKIGYFYMMQGIVSIFMPAIIGIVADRLIQAQKTLSISHAIAGLAMLGCGLIGYTQGKNVSYPLLFTIYSISVAFFMPTIALVNSVAYNALKKNGYSPDDTYPKVRIWGTIGFIIVMLLVNYMHAPTASFLDAAPEGGISFQNTYHQFLICGFFSIIMAIYAIFMPACPVIKAEGKVSLSDAFDFKAFRLFKIKDMAVFFIFSMLLGVSLQITNGFAGPFISHFSQVDAFQGGWWAANANQLISISQISETVCILLIPWAMRKFGIKGVMLISMFAWVLRFALFGIGDTGSGIWLLIMSCIVYGVAFDFFNISGSLYVEQRTGPEIRSSAQGLFMLMTNGIGATLGTIAAQQIINHFTEGRQFAEGFFTMDKAGTFGWAGAWLVFAAYALIVAMLFIFLFKPAKTKTEA